jgi:hypothetical protein
VLQVEDAAKKKLHYEQAERMLLGSFTSGLAGQAGKFVRFNLPENMDQILKIATMMNQAEIQERHNKTFYVDEARASRASDRLPRRQRRSSNGTHMILHAGVSRTESEQKGSSL